MISTLISDTELLKKMDSLQDDGMSVFVMADGLFRGALFHGTRFVNRMRANHQLGILETMVLGQACLCGALLIPTMKGLEKTVFRYDTNGPAAGFIVESDSRGSVRGYLLQDPIPIDKPLEDWDLSPFFGPGTVTLTRFPEGGKNGISEPQQGMTEIVHRNIAKDLTEYFLQSEQLYTAFNTSIQFDAQGRVIGAGGMFLQALPGKNAGKTVHESIDSELMERIEHAFLAAPSFGQWFSEGGSRDDIIHGLFRDFKPAVALERSVLFDCPCRRERFGGFLKSMEKDEFNDMMKNGSDPIEIICHYCGSVYTFPKSELSS